MKKLLMLTALCLSMASCLTAHAEADKAPKESKMGQCHKTAKAKNLAGDERLQGGGPETQRQCASRKNAGLFKELMASARNTCT